MANMPKLDDFSPKSFWEKKEGTTGMIFAVGIVAGVGWALYRLLPYVNQILDNLLHTVLVGGALLALLYVAFDPKMRNLVFYVYKSFCRKLTGIFVEVDPIGIIKTHIETMHENRKKILTQIENLRKQMTSLERLIKSNVSKMTSNLQMIQTVKKKDQKEQRKYIKNVRLASAETGRLQKSNKTLKDLHVKLEGLYRTLNKVDEAVEFTILDTESRVEISIKEREAVTAGSNAIRAAQKVMNSGEDPMYDAALEYMEQDISNKVGEVERFLEVSEGFMNGVDLQNGVFEEEGWELLEQWESEGESALLGSDKQVILDQAQDDNHILDFENPVVERQDPATRENQYAKYFTN